MRRRLTNNEFIAKSKARQWPKEYGYGNTIYIGSKDKVIITCPTHGDFEQIAKDHLQGHGCPKCKADALRKTNDEFIKKATSEIVHGDTYGYGNTIYIGANDKVKITCFTHGDFEQRADHHLEGKGCPKCARNLRKTNNEFIADSNKVHGNKYEHGNTIYIGSKGKVKITCLTHGDFLQRADHHLEGKGCPKCARNLRKTNNEFIADSNKVHGHKYGHGNTIYTGVRGKVKITCLTHGDFEQRADHHLQGQGCPKCNNSKGEQLVSNTLTKMNLQFKQQFKSEKCQNIKKMPFDFCVKINNKKGFLIEYQGEQHYKPVKYSNKMSDEKAEEIFLGIKARDKMKRVYARKNNIPLLIISYKQKDIIDKLLANFIYDNFDLKNKCDILDGEERWGEEKKQMNLLQKQKKFMGTNMDMGM